MCSQQEATLFIRQQQEPVETFKPQNQTSTVGSYNCKKQNTVNMLYAEFCPTPRIYMFRTLIPNVIVFGDLAFKDVIKIRWDQVGGS